MMRTIAVTVAMLAGLMFTSSVRATLFDRGSGLIYDSDLNITWTQNANLCVALNNCIGPNGGTPGAMTWDNANSWANNLVFGGFDDWRLASTDVNGDKIPVDCKAAIINQTQCKDNEYDYMYIYNLGGTGNDKTGTQLPFNNIQSLYWGSEVNSNVASFILFSNGVQFTSNKTATLAAWAVRNGDVLRVPEPRSILLLGIGLLGFRLARRWRKS